MTEVVNIQVLTTTKVKELSYQVLAGGKILESKHENFRETNEHILKFKPTIYMLPKASVVVYYIAENGEIISDKIDVEFGNQLINQVSYLVATVIHIKFNNFGHILF